MPDAVQPLVPLDALKAELFRFVAADVETTGAGPGGICQIGLAAVRDDGTILTHSQLVDPGRPISPQAGAIHGITAADLVGAPDFPAALRAVRPVMEAHALVQQSRFDARAFASDCRDHGLGSIAAHWTDSRDLARRAWPELRGNGGHGLASLKAHLGLTFRHHDAGDDAYAAARVVLAAEAVLGRTPALRRRAVQFGLDL